MTIVVSAPGKIFLMGEHAVVYGKPALLACVNKRVSVTVEEGKSMTRIQSLDNNYILEIVDFVKNHFKMNSFPSLSITVSSQIKSGYHLGSSAAVAVATIAALLFFLKKIWNPELVNKLAYEVEKIKHGNPSGADNSTVIFGGFVWYRKELENLKSIWQVPIKMPSVLNHFYLVDTGNPKESTYEMVARVAKAHNQNKNFMDHLFNINEESTKKIAASLKEKDIPGLIDSIKIGQSSLEQIGVVGKNVIPFIRSIEKKGGAAKILGGGGLSTVGYLLCFHENLESFKKLVKLHKYSFEPITLGEEGLRLEKGKK